jgi:hypothetical protein
MFIRIKKIQDKYYAYHVENKRVHGKVKQKVKAYLGKVCIPKKINNISFSSILKSNLEEYIRSKTYKEIIEDLIRWELLRHELTDINLNIKTYSVEKENQKIVIKMNEGYLYDKTLTDLLRFQAVGEDEYFIGKEFAELFIKSGIEIPKDLFVKLFDKITNK